MAAGRDDPAVVEEEHAIGQGDGRDAIRDDDQRRVELAAKAVEDLRLDRRIDRGRGVVEDQHAWLTQQRARQRDSLTLAAGQCVPPLPHHRVVAIGQARDEPVGPREPGRPPNPFVVHVKIQRDVLPHRGREQKALLEHDRGGATEVLHVGVPQVDPPDPDGAVVGIVQANEQLRQRALPGSRRADDRHGLLRPDLERHAVEDRIVVVDERHAVERDAEGPGRQPHRLRGGLQGDRLGEDLLETLASNDGSRQVRQDPADEPHRPREQIEQRDELHELADRDRVRRDPPRSDGEQGDDAEARKSLERGLESRADAPRRDTLQPELLGLRRQPLHLRGLAAQCLDDEGAVDAFVCHRGDLADLLLRSRRRPLHPAGERAIQRGERRQPREADEREERIRRDQRHDREDDEEDHSRRERHRMKHIDGRLHVGLDVGQELPRRPRPVIGERQIPVLVGDAAPKRRLDARPRHPRVVAADHDAGGPQDAHRDDQPCAPDDRARRDAPPERGDEDPVRGATEHGGAQDAGGRIDGGADDRHRERQRVRPDIGADDPHAADEGPSRFRTVARRHLPLPPKASYEAEMRMLGVAGARLSRGRR